MKKYLLPENGNYYKSNLHCHSVFSDGKFTPAELKEIYKSLGYSILSVTDHEGFFYHPELDDDEFLSIAGYELSFDMTSDKPRGEVPTCHLCLYKKDPSDIYQPGYDENYVNPHVKWTVTPEMKSRIKGKGEPFDREYTHENINNVMKILKDEVFIITYNHPKWSMEGYEDYILHDGMHNLEIYNHDSCRAGHDERNGEVFDAYLRKGRKLFVTACDDNHDSSTANRIGGFTMFKAPSLTYENIMNAFEKGEFYASEGPEIDELYVEDGNVVLKSKTPLRYVSLITGTRYTSRCAGDPIYEVSLPIRPGCKYIRLEACDLQGRKAYTNAYWLEDIL